MTIEVRQLLIRSNVGFDAGASREGQGQPSEEGRERLKEELLAECKTWFMEKLRDSRER
jgi:hypothetical protein